MGNNSFSALSSGENAFSRRWGSTTKGAVDPYISGYIHVNWDYIPDTVADAVAVAGGTNEINGLTEIQNILNSSVLSVTLPAGTLNKTEFSGLGGITWAAPTSVTYDTTLSMRFIETSAIPIYSIFHGWVRLIRDYRAGVSRLEGAYTRSNYAATVYYFTTTPDGKTVENYYCLPGVFPLRDPSDLFGHDITTNEKLEIDLDFNTDQPWHEQWVYEKCTSIADTYYNAWQNGAGVIGSYEQES